MVEDLYARGVAFHFLLVPPNNSDGGHGASSTCGVKVYVAPRQNQAVQENSSGFKMAAAETFGFGEHLHFGRDTCTAYCLTCTACTRLP